ncbi:MAG: ROK family transcriptional regulator [Pseudomonadota bacterium]
MGTNRDGVRARNERLLLTHVHQNGAMAKADIARASGLSAQTVSVIMRNLEADGLLRRGQPVRGRVGQPSVPMGLEPEGAYSIGLKVGRRSLDMVLVDFSGQVRHRIQRTHAYPQPDETIAFAVESYETLLTHLPADRHDRIAGLGIAIPFQLWAWAKPLGAPEKAMGTWRDVDLRRELASRLSCPVILQNDASAACNAELTFGPPDRPREFLHFYVAYFIGGGVVQNGRLLTGRTENAGALGSIPVPSPRGSSKQLIDFASLSGLEARLQAKGQSTASLWSNSEDWDIDRDILADWLDDASWGLAHAIVASVAVTNSGLVLIDGWLPQALRSDLVDATQDKICSVPHIGVDLPEIVAGNVGADARVLGAASLPLSERYFLETQGAPLGE